MVCLSFLWVRSSPLGRHLTQTNPDSKDKVIFRDHVEKSKEEVYEAFFIFKNKKREDMKQVFVDKPRE